MDSIDLIKSKSIRGLSTPPCLESKKDDAAINIAEICFPLQKTKKQENQIHGPYCDERELQRKQLALVERGERIA